LLPYYTLCFTEIVTACLLERSEGTSTGKFIKNQKPKPTTSQITGSKGKGRKGKNSEYKERNKKN
jgi:hypothetical protein